MHDVLPADRVVAQVRFDEFFSRALDAQAEAEARSGGPVRRRFRIADAEVDFRLAHSSLAPLLCDALAHVEIPTGGEPDYVVHIWDEESSGVAAPPACWNRSDLLAYGEIPRFIDADRYLHVDLDRAMVGAGNRTLGKAIVWVRSPRHLGQTERAAPLLALLNWIASEAHFSIVHAASVGRSDAGVLIVGPSGAGKSHAALACIESDLFYVGDDRCLLGIDGGPFAASLYSTGKLFSFDLHRFPILHVREKSAIHNAEGKAVFFLNDIVPQRLSCGVPLRAVVLPRYGGGHATKVSRAAAGAGLLQVGAYAVRWPSLGQASLSSIAAALRRLPCFHLETGTDMTEIPKAISDLLDVLAGQQTERLN
jgi:hypothetical protein